MEQQLLTAAEVRPCVPRCYAMIIMLCIMDDNHVVHYG